MNADSDLLRLFKDMLEEQAEWRKDAHCHNHPTNIFFHPDNLTPPQKEKLTARARRVCGACPVREECLEYAMEAGERGFWGGTTESERRTLRSTRRRQEM